MIERLKAHDRVKVARRQRELANALLAVAACGVLIGFANFFGAPSNTAMPEGIVLIALWLSQFAWLLLVILYFVIFACCDYIFSRTISAPLLRIVVGLLSLVPILHVLLGIVLCVQLRNDWIAHGIAASWRGVSRDARRMLWTELWCHSCGYNLQGNKSGTCPECGKRIEATA